jgi:hypothetical protein
MCSATAENPVEGVDISFASPGSSSSVRNLLLHSSLLIFHVFLYILFLFHHIDVTPFTDISTYFPSICLHFIPLLYIEHARITLLFFWILVIYFALVS